MYCPRCGYKFHRNFYSELYRHLERKTPCDMKYVKVERSSIVENADKYLIEFYNIYDKMSDKDKKELDNVSKPVKTEKKKPKISKNNGININSYNNSDISCLKNKDFIIKTFTNTTMLRILTNIYDEIHVKNDKNHNILINSRFDDKCFVIMDNNKIEKSTIDILYELNIKYLEELILFLNNNDKVKEKYDEFFNKIVKTVEYIKKNGKKTDNDKIKTINASIKLIFSTNKELISKNFNKNTIKNVQNMINITKKENKMKKIIDEQKLFDNLKDKFEELGLEEDKILDLCDEIINKSYI